MTILDYLGLVLICLAAVVVVGYCIARDEMTDTEINKALALKIGYLPEHVRLGESGSVVVAVSINMPHLFIENAYWRKFDYMDWATIIPIAVKYGVETGCNRFSHYAYLPSKRMAAVHEKTLQKAIALAVLNKP